MGGMHKTTLYLSDELEHDIAIAARQLGISRSEFLRRAAARLAAETRRRRPERREPYTVLPPRKNGPRTMEEIDDAIYESIKRRVAKR